MNLVNAIQSADRRRQHCTDQLILPWERSPASETTAHLPQAHSLLTHLELSEIARSTAR